jgi:hypothetical protein
LRLHAIEERLLSHDRLLACVSTSISELRTTLSSLSSSVAEIRSTLQPSVDLAISEVRSELATVSARASKSCGCPATIEALRFRVGRDLSALRAECASSRPKKAPAKQRCLPAKNGGLKFVCIGSPFCGKSRFAHRFQRGPAAPFADPPTFGTVPPALPVTFGGRSVNVELWNMAGLEENWDSVSDVLCNGAHGLLLFYATDKQPSFECLADFFASVRRFIDDGAKAMVVMWRARGEEKIGASEGQVLAIRENMLFAEVGDDYEAIKQVVATLAEEVVVWPAK